MSNILVYTQQVMDRVREIHKQNEMLLTTQEMYLKKEMQLMLEIEKLKQELHQAKVQSKKQEEQKEREEKLKQNDVNFQELLADHIKHQKQKGLAV